MKKGDIYFYAPGQTTGCEMQKTRPGVIVSCDANNLYSDNVTVVPITAQPKSSLPTHTQIGGTIHGTVLTEQIRTISKQRLGNFCGHITEPELQAIDKCICKHLGISLEAPTNDQTRALETERDTWKQAYTEIVKAVVKGGREAQ